MYFFRFVLAFGLLLYWADAMHTQYVICYYVVYLSRSCSYRTIKTYLSGLTYLYKMYGLPHPLHTAGFHLQRLLAGVKRAKGDDRNPKRPITPRILLAMYYLLHLHTANPDPDDVVLYAAMLVAFFGFFRKGNVAAKSACWEENTHCFTRDDICFDIATYTVWIRVTMTKTIQHKERVLWVPMRGLKGSPLDVFAALTRAFAAVPAAGSAHAFVQSDGRPLLHTTFVARVKELIASMGLDPSNVAGHSFRRGGASFALYCNVPHAFIKLMGDWRSNAFLAYFSVPHSSKVKVTDCMVHVINSGDYGDEIYYGDVVEP